MMVIKAVALIPDNPLARIYSSCRSGFSLTCTAEAVPTRGYLANRLFGLIVAKSLVAGLVLASLASAGEVVEVSIEKMLFEPQMVKIKPGVTVKWVNNERRNNHSILFDKEGHPESERFFPGESWQRTFDKPGVYPYRCGPHPEMTGVVEVAE